MQRQLLRSEEEEGVKPAVLIGWEHYDAVVAALRKKSHHGLDLIGRASLIPDITLAAHKCAATHLCAASKSASSTMACQTACFKPGSPRQTYFSTCTAWHACTHASPQCSQLYTECAANEPLKEESQDFDCRYGCHGQEFGDCQQVGPILRCFIELAINAVVFRHATVGLFNFSAKVHRAHLQLSPQLRCNHW